MRTAHCAQLMCHMIKKMVLKGKKAFTDYHRITLATAANIYTKLRRSEQNEKNDSVIGLYSFNSFFDIL